MSDDIFQSWKDNRFVIAPEYLRLDEETQHFIILTDIGYWANHADVLEEWCRNYGCTIKGMTVEIPTDDLLTAFCARWA